MLQLKLIFLTIVILEFQPAFGLKCHKCRYWEGSTEDPSCLSSPSPADLYDIGGDKDHLGKDYYCVTEIMTIKGHREILRRYVSSNKNLTGISEEGPIEGTDNPEKNYIRIHYCRTDGCNVHPHVDPPRVHSSIKCLVCDDSRDNNCKKDALNEYLVAADPIPSWVRESYKGFNGQNTSERVNFDATEPIGEFEYKTYCKTTVRNSTSGMNIGRGVSWFKKSDGEKNGKCEKPVKDVEHCYCNDRDGCNNRSYHSASDMVRFSLFFLILGLISLFMF